MIKSKLNFAGDYEAVRQKLRIKYDIQEGDAIYINPDILEMNGNTKKKPERKQATVLSVHKYHVTVRFPAGYCQSYQWDDFEKLRNMFPENYK